jgi:hypothetical protein
MYTITLIIKANDQVPRRSHMNLEQNQACLMNVVTRYRHQLVQSATRGGAPLSMRLHIPGPTRHWFISPPILMIILPHIEISRN